MEIANETLNAHGKKLSADAWLAIGKKTGYGLRNSMGAIEQIISYAGDKKTINSSDIEEAIGKSKEDIVFDLTAALSEKNFRRALVTLNNLFEQGMNHLLIHSLLAKEIRLLLHAKIVRQSGKITNYDPAMEYGYFQKTVYPTIKACSSDTGGETLDFATQNPYVIFLALKNTERFSLSNLKRHLQNLVSIDIYFKSTSKDPKLTLEHFILDVCSS